MNTMNNIVFIATICTSLCTILITFKKVNEVVNKFWTDFNRYHLYTLKIAVLSEELPIIDRLHAGEEYIKLGGNGLIKLKYEELLKEAYKELEK